MHRRRRPLRHRSRRQSRRPCSLIRRLGPILAGGTGRRTGPGPSDGGMGIGSILGAILRGGVVWRRRRQLRSALRWWRTDVVVAAAYTAETPEAWATCGQPIRKVCRPQARFSAASSDAYAFRNVLQAQVQGPRGGEGWFRGWGQQRRVSYRGAVFFIGALPKKKIPSIPSYSHPT